MIYGSPRAGKTASLHHLPEHRADNRHRISYIQFAMLNRNNVVRFISEELGLTPLRSLSAGFKQLQRQIKDIQPVNPVSIFDEV